MIRYSIADLENITGIKAHTIRIWEKRYNIIKPFRTTTNIRYYDNDQMLMLVNVAALIRSGMKISKIDKLSAGEIADEINSRLSGSSQTDEDNYEVYTAQLITFGLEFNENAFNTIFSNAMLRYRMLTCYEKILLPMMNRVGLYWSTNRLNPAQEHFVSNLLKQKLSAAIDSLPPTSSLQQPSLLFLPQNENHELGLLMAKYILRNAGKQVVYLGPQVPFDNLKSTVEQTRPSQMLFFLIQLHPFEELQNYIDRISVEFKNMKIFVAGFPSIFSKLNIPDNIILIPTPDEFDKMLS